MTVGVVAVVAVKPAEAASFRRQSRSTVPMHWVHRHSAALRRAHRSRDIPAVSRFRRLPAQRLVERPH